MPAGFQMASRQIEAWSLTEMGGSGGHRAGNAGERPATRTADAAALEFAVVARLQPVRR